MSTRKKTTLFSIVTRADVLTLRGGFICQKEISADTVTLIPPGSLKTVVFELTQEVYMTETGTFLAYGRTGDQSPREVWVHAHMLRPFTLEDLSK